MPLKLMLVAPNVGSRGVEVCVAFVSPERDVDRYTQLDAFITLFPYIPITQVGVKVRKKCLVGKFHARTSLGDDCLLPAQFRVRLYCDRASGGQSG